jgi:hypothetical protein
LSHKADEDVLKRLLRAFCKKRKPKHYRRHIWTHHPMAAELSSRKEAIAFYWQVAIKVLRVESQTTWQAIKKPTSLFGLKRER